MFEKVNRSLKYDLKKQHIYIRWTPRPITLPHSRCTCGVMIDALSICVSYVHMLDVAVSFFVVPSFYWSYKKNYSAFSIVLLRST